MSTPSHHRAAGELSAMLRRSFQVQVDASLMHGPFAWAPVSGSGAEGWPRVLCHASSASALASAASASLQKGGAMLGRSGAGHLWYVRSSESICQ